jgi:hypothetical protein
MIFQLLKKKYSSSLSVTITTSQGSSNRLYMVSPLFKYTVPTSYSLYEVLNSIIVGSKLFIVMEYVGGGSVKDIVILLSINNSIVSAQRRGSVGRGIHCYYFARVVKRSRISAQQTQNTQRHQKR